jgi:cytochrome c oxidase subunit 3
MSDAQLHVLDSPWAGGVCPFDAGWRKVMLWAFIVTDGLLFAGLLAGYGYARLAAPTWPDPGAVFDLRLIAVMTFVLISSSATMASAVAAAKHQDGRAVARFLLATMGGGAAFLALQAYEWTHLIAAGARLAANPWGVPLFTAYFFLLTGFHGSHVLSGLLILATLAVRWRRGRATAEGIELGGLYWHFVDLVWVFIFTVFYLL